MAFKVKIPLVVFIAAIATIHAAAADPIEDFYKGKTITMTVGNVAGGGYDQYARTLARHLGRFVPGNPRILVKNMAGASGLQAADRLYNLAPADGTEIVTVHRSLPLLPLVGHMTEITFDAARVGWLGSLNRESSICISWHTSRIKTFDDALTKQFIVGAAAAGASLDTFEAPLINALGAKLKVVSGYRGGQSSDLAMERGEIDGRCGASWSAIMLRNPDWLSENKINILIQFGLARHPQMAAIPLMQDLTTSQVDKEALTLLQIPTLIGRPFLVPPAMPQDRMNALRAAFDATAKDKAFLADAAKQRMEIDLVTGEESQRAIAQAYSAPSHIINRARELMRMPVD